MRHGIDPKYRVCRRCGGEWNVSSKDPGEKNYICPTCEFKAKLKARSEARKGGKV